MSLFSDLYNTLTKIFQKQEEQGNASKSVATNRLKLVLMQDRTNLTPRILEQMRSELIELLSRYVELDKELLDLNFDQEGDQVALMLSIPVIRAKDEAEIDAAIKEREENLAKLESLKIEAIELETPSENAEETSEADTTEEKSDAAEPISDQNAEEEDADAEEGAKKAEAIVDELNNIPKIIKKNKVSPPEEMISSNGGTNPFKPEELDKKIESPKEA